MYFSSILLMSAIAVSQSSAEYAETGIDFTIDQTRVQFPYFKQEAISKEMSPELAQELKDVGIEVLEFLDKWFGELLSEQRNGPKREHQLGKDLTDILNKFPKKGRELAKKFGYDKYFMDMLDRWMSKAKAIHKEKKMSGPSKGDYSLNVAVHYRFADAIEALRKSTNSVFIAWAEGKFGRDNAEDHMSEIMGRLKYAGHSAYLDVLVWCVMSFVGLSRFKSMLGN